MQLTADFEAGCDVAAAVAATADAVGMPAAPHFRIETVAQEQWCQTISDEYQPICISPGTAPVLCELIEELTKRLGNLIGEPIKLKGKRRLNRKAACHGAYGLHPVP